MAEKEVHLRDYFAIIRRHDFIVVTSFLLVFGAALTISLYMPRAYESSAVIEIQISGMPSGFSNLVSSIGLPGTEQVSMQTICERFTSRTLLAETIRNLKQRAPEMKGYPDNPDALAPRIRTRIVPDTQIIEVTVRMRRDEGGAQSAARIANELVSVMQSHRSAKTDAETDRRQEFVDDKVKVVQSQIDDSDQKIREFISESGDAIVWSARAEHLLTRLSSLVELRETSEMLLAAEKKKRHELDVRLEKEPEWAEYSRTFSRDTLWDRNRIDLAALKRELIATRAELGVGENNPKVKSLEAQIEEIMKEMRDVAQEVMSAKTESRNPTYQALLDQIIDTELNLIAYEAQLEVVEGMLAELGDEKEQMFSEMPESLFQLGKMRRETDYMVNIYKILLEKKLDSEIWASENREVDTGRVKGGIEIVDPAQLDSRPVSPRVKFIAAIAGLVGVVSGLALAFLAEYFQKTYQSPEEAGVDLDVSVLGIIPYMKEVRRGKLMFPMLESPMSAEAESFRTLAANIEFSSADRPHTALLVTSSVAREGKSFTIANLAVAMAQTKERVIIVDCDMRKAIQHKIFDIDNRIGLSNLLVSNVDLDSVIRDTDIPNLSIITCGQAPPNPLEILKSEKMGEVLSDLRKTWDVILCDSPPVLPVADALILASKLDGVLLVADLDSTSREILGEAQERLSKLDVPFLGLICNKVGTAKRGPYYYGTSAKGFMGLSGKEKS